MTEEGINLITGESLCSEIKRLVEKTIVTQKEIKKQLRCARLQLATLHILRIVSYLIIIGFLSKKLSNKLSNLLIYQYNHVEKLKDKLLDLKVVLSYKDRKCKDNLHNVTKWVECCGCWKKITENRKLYLIHRTSILSRSKNRSYSELNIIKSDFYYSQEKQHYITCDIPIINLPKIGNREVYIYPSFILVLTDARFLAKENKVTVLPIGELTILSQIVKHAEEDVLSPGSKVLEYTWKKVNENGTKDLRYKDNYQIPVIEYCVISIDIGQEYNACFMLCLSSLAHKFQEELSSYIKLVSNETDKLR